MPEQLSKREDSAAAEGDSGYVLLAVRKDVAESLVDSDEEYSALQVDANGALRVIDAAAGSVGATGGAKYAVINAATSGDNTLVAAVASKKIRVLSLFLLADAAVDLKFQTGAGGTDLTGLIGLDATAGFVLNYSPVGHFETASGALLNLNLSAAVQISGALVYKEV